MFDLKKQLNSIFQAKSDLLIVICAFFIFVLALFIVQTEFLLLAGIFLILFILARGYFWFLLFLVPPVLSLGLNVSIPLTEAWQYDMTLAEIFIVLTLLDFFIATLISNFSNLKFSLLTYALGLYVVVALTSGFYAPDKQLFFAGLKIPVFMFFAYTLSSHYLNTPRRIKWFMFSLATTVLIISAQIMFLFYESGFSARFFFDRSSLNVSVGAIAFASSIIVMLLPTIFSFSLMQVKNNLWHFIFIFSFVFGFVAVFFTLGKGAILSLGIGLGFLFITLKYKRHYLFLISLATIIVLAAIFAPLFQGIFERLSTTFVDTNTHFRVREYAVMWRIMKENWLIGVGMGQQLNFYSRWLYPGYQQLANNMILQMAMDLGAMGLGVMIFIFASLTQIINKAFAKIYNQSPILLYGICASVISSFFNGLVEVTYFGLAYAIIFWLLMGIISNVNVYEKNISYNN